MNEDDDEQKDESNNEANAKNDRHPADEVIARFKDAHLARVKFESQNLEEEAEDEEEDKCMKEEEKQGMSEVEDDNEDGHSSVRSILVSKKIFFCSGARRFFVHAQCREPG